MRERIVKDAKFTAKGATNPYFKGKKITVKGISNADLEDIKVMLKEEIRRQNEEEAEGGKI